MSNYPHHDSEGDMPPTGKNTEKQPDADAQPKTDNAEPKSDADAEPKE